MGERREFTRAYHNTQAGDSPAWLEEAAPLHMPQMDIADANLFGMERFLEGEGPSEQAEHAPTLRLRGAESRGLPLRMTGGRGSHDRQGGAPSLPAVQAGPSGVEGGSAGSRPAGRDSNTLDPTLGCAAPSVTGRRSSVETQAGPTGGSRSDSRGSVQTGRRSEGGPQRPEGAKRRGKRKLPVPDLDAIEDPLERRKQRRLLKNRNTAAASRERKQRDLDALTGRLQTLERDNAALKDLLSNREGEIQALSAQVVSLSERLGDEAPSAGVSGDGGTYSGEAAGQQEEPQEDLPNARSGVGDPLLALHQGRPLPASEHAGQAGTPGLVVGVDGQWLRLRPGFELLPVPPAPGGANPRRSQQEQQREVDGRTYEAERWQPPRQHGEGKEQDDDSDDADPADDDGGRDSDPQWEPGRKSRKKGRRSS